jgi:hypothetical protein
MANDIKPMSEARRHPKLFVIFGCQILAYPLPKCGRVLPQIYRYIKNFAIKDTNQFALRVLVLIVESSQGTLRGPTLVVLNKYELRPTSLEIASTERLHEITTIITTPFRL